MYHIDDVELHDRLFGLQLNLDGMSMVENALREVEAVCANTEEVTEDSIKTIESVMSVLGLKSESLAMEAKKEWA